MAEPRKGRRVQECTLWEGATTAARAVFGKHHARKCSVIQCVKVIGCTNGLHTAHEL